MKKLIITLSLIAFGQLLSAQTDLYFKVKKIINAAHPEISLDDHLVAFNIWSAADNESREANKSFEKAYKIYADAKLKGGSKGIVVVSINKDNLASGADIILHKDGIEKSIPVKADDSMGLSSSMFNNMVFDSNGSVVYKNLSSASVFESIHQLITR